MVVFRNSVDPLKTGFSILPKGGKRFGGDVVKKLSSLFPLTFFGFLLQNCQVNHEIRVEWILKFEEVANLLFLYV